MHLAEDVTTSQHLAVKIISGRLLASTSGDGVRRFRREAKAASAIDSPHIVRVLDSGEDEHTGELFIVMEHLDGDDLQRVLERVGPLAPSVALRIAVQALRGLVRAHEARIIHRDIKPANLFLARQPNGEMTVKLLDFGIAKIKADPLDVAHSTGLTTTGTFLGSPLYMSPEQVQSSKDIDERTDLWSLGATLYCALTGQAPHQHISAVGKLIFTICSTPAPPLRERAPWISAEIARAVHQALTIDPDKRFSSAAEMLASLEMLLPNPKPLHEDELVVLTEAERVEKPPSSLELGQTQPAPPALHATVKVEAESAPAKVLTDEPLRMSAPTNTQTVPSLPKEKRSPAYLVGGLLIVGLGALGIMQKINASTDGPSRVITSPIDAAPSVSGAFMMASTQPLEELRKVEVTITPEDAKVEVDRGPVGVQAGKIEIAGRLGSVHQVRLVKGEFETTRNVIITEQGAVPGKVEIEAAAAAMTTTPGKPAGPPAVAVSTSVKTNVPPTPPTTPTITITTKKPEDVLMPED